MAAKHKETVIEKKSILNEISKHGDSALQRYQHFFVGSNRFADLLRYELIIVLLSDMPGALGLLLRKKFYPVLFRDVGSGVVWGRNISLRNPKRISIGNKSAIDDNCLLDGKGHEEGIIVGDNVIIARDALIQAKYGPITIGDDSIISSQCQLTSVGGIIIGNYVMMAGQCYIGGGRYKTDDITIPIKDQDLYSIGPTIIEDDVWIGAGVVIQDGVRIGHGSVIGSGATIREDIPENTVVAPHFRNVMLPRNQS